MLLDKYIPLTYILAKVKIELVFILVVNLVVFLLTYHFNHLLPVMPLAVPAFIGTSISVLLSFKLNQSYDRWWEARKIWGSIVNDSRSLVLQLQTFLAPGNDPVIKKIAYRQIAWCYSLSQSLRKLNATDNVAELLSTDEVSFLNNHTNKPLALLQLHSADLRKLKAGNQIETLTLIQVDNTLVRLCDSMGKAERIKSTVFPVTYRLFLHFLIYLFVITLDVALIDTVWYFEVPLLLLLSGTFFLLEKSARNMQYPFENKPTDIAMTTIANTIETNIRQLLKETNLPVKEQQDKFYIL